MNSVCEAKEKTLRARPGAVAVRLNSEREEWNVWAGSFTGAQFLGRGRTESEAWKAAEETSKRTNPRKTIRCPRCGANVVVDETECRRMFCNACSADERVRK